ncbi:putative ABC transporter permease [Vagococcus carniphilus]
MQHLFMIFIVYAFIGWLWESFFCSFKAKHFVYRGFLLGPYCPVYGFGVVAVLLLIPKEYGTMLNLYFNIVVIVTIVEYITSWLLEKFFQMQLWDYSEVPLNIHGRVAVPVSVFWGFGCLFLVQVIQPRVDEMIHTVNQVTNGWLPVVLFVIFSADVLSTLLFTLTTKKEVEAVVDTSDSENAVIKEYRLKHLFVNHEESNSRQRVLEHLHSKKPQLKHRNLHRIVNNYPNFKLKK